MQMMRFEVPFPQEWGSGQATNAYLLRGKENILIDTGFDSQSNRNLIKSALRRLGGWKVGKILITHGHLDHFGLSAYIQEETGAEILIHEDDSLGLRDYRKTMDWFDDLYTQALEGGFASDELKAARIELFTAVELMGKPREYRTFRNLELDEEGGKVHSLHLPGHTQGSVGYAIGDSVFSGDVALEGSTTVGELRLEMTSIEKLKAFKEVHTGHRRTPIGPTDLEALEAHIATRLEVVLRATRVGKSLKGIVNELYPLATGAEVNFMKKIIPIRQVLSYLHYLEGEGLVANTGSMWFSFKNEIGTGR